MHPRTHETGKKKGNNNHGQNYDRSGGSFHFVLFYSLRRACFRLFLFGFFFQTHEIFAATFVFVCWLLHAPPRTFRVNDTLSQRTECVRRVSSNRAT